MQRLYYLLIATILLLTASCGLTSGEVVDNLRDAEQAIARGDMKAAQSAGDYILGDENFSGLSASQLARLSMVYMQLADSVDQTSNIRKAADLYDRAQSLDADSAAEVYNNLPPDQLQYYAAMSEYSASRKSPVSLDSLPEEDEAMELNLDTLP
ncbi:MAG: hypothetical protein K2K79_01200 [Paramuribaculum sp.]|nr:hypothetical protein [Paramuribaculum sp.]